MLKVSITLTYQKMYFFIFTIFNNSSLVSLLKPKFKYKKYFNIKFYISFYF